MSDKMDASVQIHVTGNMMREDGTPSTLDIKRDGDFVFAITTKVADYKIIATHIAFGIVHPNVLEAVIDMMFSQFGDELLIPAWEKSMRKREQRNAM